MTWDLMPFLSKVLQVLIILNKENGSESSKGRICRISFWYNDRDTLCTWIGFWMDLEWIKQGRITFIRNLSFVWNLKRNINCIWLLKIRCHCRIVSLRLLAGVAALLGQKLEVTVSSMANRMFRLPLLITKPCYPNIVMN